MLMLTFWFSLQFDEFKVESMSSVFGDDVKFNSEVNDLDSDLMMQWNLESCFGNGS